MISGSFLVTVCGWCQEQYFVTEVGKGHGCAQSQNPVVEKIVVPDESPLVATEMFGGGRRVAGKY